MRTDLQTCLATNLEEREPCQEAVDGWLMVVADLSVTLRKTLSRCKPVWSQRRLFGAHSRGRYGVREAIALQKEMGAVQIKKPGLFWKKAIDCTTATRGGPESERSEKWYQEACELDAARGCWNGRGFYTAEMGDKDEEQAQRASRKIFVGPQACDAGDLRSCVRLGQWYDYPLGVQSMPSSEIDKKAVMADMQEDVPILVFYTIVEKACYSPMPMQQVCKSL